MSQDLQLSSMSGLSQADYVPAGSGGGGQNNNNPMTKLHRLLRGRYPIVIILALLFGAVGGRRRLDHSQAVLRQQWRDRARSGGEGPSAKPNACSRCSWRYVGVQEQVIQSPRIVQAALNSKEWKATGRSFGPEALAAFTANSGDRLA